MKFWSVRKWDTILSSFRSGNPMQVGKAISKIFLSVVFILAILPQYTDQGGWQLRVFAFLLAPSNEIGDTLAGLAGVLAFLWIIITVWLQSQELAAQRKELQLTRLEMHEQRKATQEMAKALQAQAEVFLDEKLQRQEARTGEKLHQLLMLLVSRLELFRGNVWIEVPPGRHLSGVPSDRIARGKTSDYRFLFFPNLSEAGGVEEAVENLCLQLLLTAEIIKNAELAKVEISEKSGNSEVEELIKIVEEILALDESLSQADQRKLQRLRIAVTLEQLRLLKTKCTSTEEGE